MAGIIELLDVVHAYSQYQQDQEGMVSNPALRGATLSIQAGEFTAVVGENGSGKSTLAKHLNALLVPDSGIVLVDGLDTSLEENLWEIRRRVGMVFQNPDNQIVSSIVEEDVAFGLENLGVPREEIRTRVDEALSVVGMADAAQKAPHMLSGGQKQRVAIAGIIAMRPKIIVFDESTAMLDPMGRSEVLAMARKLNKENGITVVWITHFMEEVLQVDRVVAMEAGRVVLEGSPQAVLTQRERLRTLGLVPPPMVELAGQLREAGLALPGEPFLVEEMAEALCPLLPKN